MYNVYGSVGEETVWGTPATRNKFFKLHEGTGIDQLANRDVATIMGANSGADPEAIFDKSQYGTGKIIIPTSYDDGALLKILKHALGLYAGTGTVAPFTHTFTRALNPTFGAGAVPTAVALSVEVNMELPDVIAGPTSLQARLLEGSKVKALTVGWEAEQEIKCEVEFLAEQCTQITKTGSPTFPDYENYLQKFAQATLTVDGVPAASVVKGFTLTLDNGYVPVITLGSINTREPKRVGKSDPSGTMKMLWDGTSSIAKAIWDKYKANTASAVVLTIQGPVGFQWVVTLNNLKWTAARMAAQEGQLQECEFDFTCLHDATNTAVKIAIQNSIDKAVV